MLNLFFPHLCCGCDRRLADDSMVLCVNCREQLALSFPKDLKNNNLTRQFYGRIELQSGFALLRFEPSNLCRDLIHKLKYQGQQQLGIFFAHWMTALMKDRGEVPDFDCIIPVPLSKKRMRKRGYNQVDKFASTLGKAFDIPVYNNGLIRKDSAASSVKLGRKYRFEHTHRFALGKNSPIKENWHVLLVDDTITTGATLEACAEVLLNATPVRLSFATIAMNH